MIYLRLIAEAGVTISLAYYFAAIFAALRFARRALDPPPPLPKIAPRVAVLKPLHGLGTTLVDNLVSFLELAYPRVEYLFGVSGYDDRAAEAVVSLRARYQFANLTLVVGEEPGGSNRKVAKLIRMAERAPKAEIFVLSDADVSVPPEHLRRIVGELIADERTAVVTCAYRAHPVGTFASRLEALFVNTDFAPQVILAAATEPMRYALGATIAVKRAALEAIGGFKALKDLLADDFFLGRMITERGWNVRLSSSLVSVACEERGICDFWRHQLRWARTYRTARPVSLATIFIHGPFWALVALALSGGSLAAIEALVAIVLVRLAMAAVMLRWALQLPELSSDLWWLLPKDLMLTGIWFASLISNRVMWAGRRFKIMRGGAMREVVS